MKIYKFEEIIAWQKAQDLAVNIYIDFQNSKDWDFRNQICRASVSISNNIAEGFNRSSNTEFKRFLYIAIASCSEVRSMLYLAQRLGHLADKNIDDLLEQTEEISRVIRGLIKYLDSHPVKETPNS